jgi:hypothetical protein
MKLTILARFRSHQSSESFVPSRMQTRTGYPPRAVALQILCALYSRSPPQDVSWIFVPSMHISSSRQGFSLALFGKIVAGFHSGSVWKNCGRVLVWLCLENRGRTSSVSKI